MFIIFEESVAFTACKWRFNESQVIYLTIIPITTGKTCINKALVAFNTEYFFKLSIPVNMCQLLMLL